MKRRHFLSLIPLGAVLAACSSSPAGNGGNPPPPPPPPGPPPPPPPPPPGGIGANMTIADNRFVDPDGNENQNATVTINSGQAVRWTNTGAVLHTVTSTDVPGGAQAFDSGDIAVGAVFDHTFTVAGTYTYRCENHPAEMLDATVIVQ